MSFEQPSPRGLGNLGGSRPTLGNLAQSARGKQIKQARTILIVVGVLQMVGGVALLALLGGNAPALQGNEELRRAMPLLMALSFGIGVVFIVLGLLTKKYPVPTTMLGLIIYAALLAMNLLNGTVATAPASLIIPVIIVIALARSVQSAIVYQRELNEAARPSDSLP